MLEDLVNAIQRLTERMRERERENEIIAITRGLASNLCSRLGARESCSRREKKRVLAYVANRFIVRYNENL